MWEELQPFLADDEDRDVMMNTVAPVWDGNETWLVLGGAGLFGAFQGEIQAAHHRFKECPVGTRPLPPAKESEAQHPTRLPPH